MNDKTDEAKDRRWAAQATLWVSIETGLRLLHPMMPFVTEELWQRLPGRGTLGDDEVPSIMLAQYPQCPDPKYKDDAIEQSMTTTMDIVKACRSLRASYNINNKVSTHFFIKASTEKADIATAQNDDIVTLGKASKGAEWYGGDEIVEASQEKDRALANLICCDNGKYVFVGSLSSQPFFLPFSLLGHPLWRRYLCRSIVVCAALLPSSLLGMTARRVRLQQGKKTEFAAITRQVHHL